MKPSSAWTAPLRPLGRAGENLLDRALCVLGAVGLSQAPEFFQQYQQRLGGHLDEARRALARYEEVAREGGLTLAQLIETTRAQTAAPVARLGDVMAETLDRVRDLEAAEAALRDASAWERPLVFLRHVDPEIAARAWEIFKPAVPVTLEGLAYAGAGMVLALLLYQVLVVLPGRALVRRWRRPRVIAEAEAGASRGRG